MAASVTLMTSNGRFTKKNMRLFQRTKRQVLVSEVSFVKRKRDLSFEITSSLFASHEVNRPYLT